MSSKPWGSQRSSTKDTQNKISMAWSAGTGTFAEKMGVTFFEEGRSHGCYERTAMALNYGGLELLERLPLAGWLTSRPAPWLVGGIENFHQVSGSFANHKETKLVKQ
jgi:hypothetical protein